MDTGKDAYGHVMYKANSTVSRYACRIICERQPPYTARLYAGAFDMTNRIKPSVRSPFIPSLHNYHIFNSRLFHHGRYQLMKMTASLPMVLACCVQAAVLPLG